MGKSKKHKSGTLQTAAKMRAEYRRWLILLAIGIVVCVIAVFAYMSFVTLEMSASMGIMPWVTALFAAAVLGWFGNRFSRAHRAYEEFIERHGLSSSDVKSFIEGSK